MKLSFGVLLVVLGASLVGQSFFMTSAIGSFGVGSLGLVLLGCGGALLVKHVIGDENGTQPSIKQTDQ